MQFLPISIIDEMIALYHKPREVQTRFFDGYLGLIRTPDKKDIQRPLTFFNPMAREHILEKLQLMQSEGFEEHFSRACEECSGGTNPKVLQTFWNLADDIRGGWTEKDEVLITSKKIRPYITRGFCVIVFFASEEITPELIQERVREYTKLYDEYT